MSLLFIGYLNNKIPCYILPVTYYLNKMLKKLKNRFFALIMIVLISIGAAYILTSNPNNKTQNPVNDQPVSAPVETEVTPEPVPTPPAFVKTRDPDIEKLEKQIRDYLGSKINDFGVYVYDSSSDETLSINGNTDFGPASIIKVPYAVLVLRDIDAGKYTLDTTFKVRNKDKFSTYDPIGSLPEGTPVKISKYLSDMISISSNTALQHLDTFLGTADVINPRINNELGIDPYYNYPQRTNSNAVGKMMKGILQETYLTKESNEYLLNLMRNAAADLKVGVSNGLPSSIKFVNKVGFYDTDNDLAYQDAAIIWGEKTNYVLVVLDKKIDWASAQARLKEISKKVYAELNK